MPPSRHGAGGGVPNVGGVFRDGPIAGEFTRAGYIRDGHSRPGVRIFVQFAEPLLGLGIRRQISQVHEIVPSTEQRFADWRKYPWLVAAKVIALENQIQSLPRLW